MSYYLGSDLRQFLWQGDQRPALHLPGQRQPTEKVAQIIGQSEQLKPNLIVHEIMTGNPGQTPGDSVSVISCFVIPGMEFRIEPLEI